MLRFWILMIVWLMAPQLVWAERDSFCGPGPHRHSSACQCTPLESQLCLCHSEDTPAIVPALREALPVWLAAHWVDLPAPTRAPWTLTPAAEPLAPHNWSCAPATRPPRA